MIHGIVQCASNLYVFSLFLSISMRFKLHGNTFRYQLLLHNFNTLIQYSHYNVSISLFRVLYLTANASFVNTFPLRFISYLINCIESLNAVAVFQIFMLCMKISWNREFRLKCHSKSGVKKMATTRFHNVIV